jgi:hypothetical protein
MELARTYNCRLDSARARSFFNPLGYVLCPTYIELHLVFIVKNEAKPFPVSPHTIDY